MTRRIRLLLLISITSLSACGGSKLCGDVATGEPAPDLAELIPSSGKICFGGPTEVVADWPDDANAFVALNEHLEAKGFARTRQDTDDPQLMFVEFEQSGKPHLIASIEKDDHYKVWRVRLRARR